MPSCGTFYCVPSGWWVLLFALRILSESHCCKGKIYVEGICSDRYLHEYRIDVKKFSTLTSRGQHVDDMTTNSITHRPFSIRQTRHIAVDKRINSDYPSLILSPESAFAACGGDWNVLIIHGWKLKRATPPISCNEWATCVCMERTHDSRLYGFIACDYVECWVTLCDIIFIWKLASSNYNRRVGRDRVALGTHIYSGEQSFRTSCLNT